MATHVFVDEELLTADLLNEEIMARIAEVTNDGTGVVTVVGIKTRAAKVTGSSGSWSWWYRDLGDRVEVYAAYSATLAAQGSSSQSLGLPAGWGPAEEIPVAGVSSTSTYPVAARLSTSGSLTVRNVHTASIAGVFLHTTYTKAA